MLSVLMKGGAASGRSRCCGWVWSGVGVEVGKVGKEV